MKKLLLIINPMAGKGMYKDGLAEALTILAKGGYEVTIRFTEESGHAARLAAELGEQYDVVTCIGGDGTLSEVMEGIVHLEKQPLIGYFPLGTANDVATTLKLPKKVSGGVIRISFGPESTKEDVDACVAALREHHDTRMPML